MVLQTLIEQLNRVLATFYDEGLLDRQFEHLRSIQERGNPGFVVEVLTLFCRESERIFREIDQILERPVLDYRRILAYVNQLRGSTTSIGIRLMRDYCADFHRAYEKNDTAGVLRALRMMKQECFRLRINFQTVIELERKILANSSA